jgi:hypothetical protein
MPTNISVEKVKELIRLAERAHADPSGRADDPQRGGLAGAEGGTLPATPPELQPAADWRSAFERYLEDLPDAALDEIVSLYQGPAAPAPRRIRRRGRRAPAHPMSTELDSSSRGPISPAVCAQRWRGCESGRG